MEYSPIVVALSILFRVQIGEVGDPFHTSLRENHENALAHLPEGPAVDYASETLEIKIYKTSIFVLSAPRPSECFVLIFFFL